MENKLSFFFLNIWAAWWKDSFSDNNCWGATGRTQSSAPPTQNKNCKQHLQNNQVKTLLCLFNKNLHRKELLQSLNHYNNGKLLEVAILIIAKSLLSVLYFCHFSHNFMKFKINYLKFPLHTIRRSLVSEIPEVDFEEI